MGSGPFRLFAGAISLTMAVPASAAYVFNGTEVAQFNFVSGNNNGIQDGNARFYSATSPDIGTLDVRVTGWSIERVKSYNKYGQAVYTNYIRDSKLAVYSGGLGIISGDDDGGANNQHTADNEGRKDFFLFQFNAPVAFVSATFNTYSVLGYTKDSDATLKYGYNYDVPWNCAVGACGAFNLDGKTDTHLNSLFNGTYESPGGSSSNHRFINPNMHWGNVWVLGPSFTNTDYKIDGFKLANLAVVPEPATWLMLISGFGFVGGAMRRRRRIALATA